MKAPLPSFSSTKERIKQRIQNARSSTDRKSVTKSPADAFEDSTADLTSTATSYQMSQALSPPSAPRPNVQRPSEREGDCYHSVVSDVTWQEQELATSARIGSSLSSNPLLSPPPPAPSSLYHHGYLAEQTPKTELVSNRHHAQNDESHPTNLYSKASSVTRPQQKQSKRRASMSSVVSELTWNEPLPSPPQKTTTVLRKPGRKSDPSDAEYLASRGRDGYISATYRKEPSPIQAHRRQSLNDSVSSLVSEITWMDLEDSTRGRPLSSSISSTDAFGVSEMSYANSESSLKISDLMHSSIREVANESSGTPSNSDGSKETLGSSSSSKETLGGCSSSKETLGGSSSSRETFNSQEKVEVLSLNDAMRNEADAIPKMPIRRTSASSDEQLAVTEAYGNKTLEDSSSGSRLTPKKHTESDKASKKSKDTKPEDKDTLPTGRPGHLVESVFEISEDSTNSASDLGEMPRPKKKKKKRVKTKAGAKSKISSRKAKKGKKKQDSSEHPRDSMLDNPKTKKKAKKKKSKDSDRPKLGESEFSSSFFFETLKEAPTTKKEKMNDSERTNRTHDSDTTLKTKITRSKKKKLVGSDRSLLGTSDRTNSSSNSTLDLDELPELKDIGVAKMRRGGLDGSNHSSQSAFELGYLEHEKRPGRRPSRGGRNVDLDSSSHSVQSCLEIETTTFSIPKPSALSDKPIRPAFRSEKTAKKAKGKAVRFADGEPLRPLLPMAKKEISRDWGGGSIDRGLPSVSHSSQMSPPSLPPRRISMGRRDSIELITPSRTREVLSRPSGTSEGVNFLLDRLSAIDSDSVREPSRGNDVAPLMPRQRLSQESQDGLPPNVVNELLPTPETPVLSTPKLSARDKLGLKPVTESPSIHATPRSRHLRKQEMEKRRKASSIRKVEVLDSMDKMIYEASMEE